MLQLIAVGRETVVPSPKRILFIGVDDFIEDEGVGELVFAVVFSAVVPHDMFEGEVISLRDVVLRDISLFVMIDFDGIWHGAYEEESLAVEVVGVQFSN